MPPPPRPRKTSVRQQSVPFPSVETPPQSSSSSSRSRSKLDRHQQQVLVDCAIRLWPDRPLLGTVTAYWTAVNQEFSLIEFHGSREYTNAQKAIATCVAERRKQLATSDSGHNSITDSWTQVVDTYIRYEDEEKAQVEEAKAKAKKHRDQVYNSNLVRQNLVKNRRNKDAVGEDGYSTDSSPATEDRDDDDDRPSSLLWDEDEWGSSLGPLDSASRALSRQPASSPASNTPPSQQNGTKKHEKKTQMVRPNGRKRKRTGDQQLNQAEAMDLILNAVNGLPNTGQEATSTEVSLLNERIRNLEMRLEAQNGILESQRSKLETQTNNIMELKSVVGKLEGIIMMIQGFNGLSQGFQGGVRSNISSHETTESPELD